MGLFCTIQAGEAGPFSRIWQEQQLEMKFYEQISYFKSFESKNEEDYLKNFKNNRKKYFKALKNEKLKIFLSFLKFWKIS